MVRFLAPQLDKRQGDKPWGVTVVVSQQAGSGVSTHWFGDEDNAWWWIEKSCKKIMKSNPDTRPEVAIRRKRA